VALGRSYPLLEVRQRQGAGNVQVGTIGNAGPHGGFDGAGFPCVREGVRATDHDISTPLTVANRFGLGENVPSLNATRTIPATKGLVDLKIRG